MEEKHMIIILETERLYLRELELSDAGELAKVLSDPESMKFYPHPFSTQEVENWITWNINNYKIHGFGLWAVIRKEDDTFLGDCGITMQNIDGEQLPEVGFHVIKEFTRKGYASEAAGAVMKYAVTFNFKKIYSYCEVHNTPSQGVMIKAGMAKEKVFSEDGVKKVVYAKYLF